MRLNKWRFKSFIIALFIIGLCFSLCHKAKANWPAQWSDSGGKNKPINFAVSKPLNLGITDASADRIIWTNHTAFNYIITEIYSISDRDDVVYTLKEWNYHDSSDGANTINAVTISTDGVNLYYNETTGLTHTIEPTHHIVFDNDATDDPESISTVLKGYFNGDVN